VTVIDNLAPTVVCDATMPEFNLDDNGFVTISLNDLSINSNDNCAVTNTTIAQTAFDCSHAGVNTVTVSAIDAAGNIGTCPQEIRIVDLIDPVMECSTFPATNVISLGEDGNVILDTAFFPITDYPRTDNCYNLNFTASLNNDQNHLFTCEDIGSTFTIELSATDNSLNQATCNVDITITDDMAPMIECADNIVATLNEADIAILEATNLISAYSDNCGVETLTLSQYNLGESDLGFVDITVTATDTTGNVSSCVSNVQVVSGAYDMVCQDPITIALDTNGDAQISLDDWQNYLTVTADEVPVFDYSVLPSTQTDFDCTHLGENAVEVTIINGSSYQSECATTVIVEDNLAPVIACSDIDISLDADCSFQLVYADLVTVNNENCTAITDLNYGIEIDGQLVTDQNNMVWNWEDSMTQGTVLVSDESGNESTCMANINVIAVPAFDFSCPTDVTREAIECGTEITREDLMLPTNLSGCTSQFSNNIGANNGEADYYPIGTTEVIWTATNLLGETATCTQNVIVTDNQTPWLDLPMDTIRQCATPTAADFQTLNPGEYGDNCIDGLVVTSTWDENNAPIYKVTWTVTDGVGLSTSIDQYIIDEEFVTPADAGEDQVLNSVFTGVLYGNEPEIGQATWIVPEGIAIDDPNSSSTTVFNLNYGENEFVYEIAEDGCDTSRDTVIYTVTEFFMPTGFSPNGDNVNDLLVITGILAHPKSQLNIYDRTGQRVFSKEGYQNDWGGTGRNGALLPRDTYFYILKLQNNTSMRGSIEIKY